MVSALGLAMALQFKPDGRGGWLYRQDQIGVGLPATQQERDDYVRWYGWIVLGALPLFFALVIGPSIVIAHYIPDPDNTTGVLIAIPMMAVALGGTYAYLKYFSHAPARAFAGRTPVEPATTRQQVFGRRMRRMTYGRLAMAVGTVMAIFVVGAFQPGIPAEDRPLALMFGIGASLAIGAGLLWWKRKVETS